MSLTTLALRESLKARALDLGFCRVAIGRARPPEHRTAFDEWLAAGYAGTMSYLARGRDARVDPERLLPGAQSVVALALSYGDGARDDPSWSSIARYARGRDYHDVMRPKLIALADHIREAAGAGARTRVAVDTSAVLERDLAAAAGLGWIGKNTNLLAPGLGSYFFIGIVLTTVLLEPDEPLPDRCGTCTACLDACPTGAFPAPYVLDARRCISYLTIEHRGDIGEELRSALAGQLFGCDICQEVCPWNRKTSPRHPELEPVAPFGEAAALLALDEEGFRARFRGTAITRAKRSGLLRNAALILAGRRPEGTDALLRAASDHDPVVSGAARWALAQRDHGDEERATAAGTHFARSLPRPISRGRSLRDESADRRSRQ